MTCEVEGTEKMLVLRVPKKLPGKSGCKKAAGLNLRYEVRDHGRAQDVCEIF